MCRQGATAESYAHKDIAFEFGSAISPVFKLYLLKEYQRLKDAEKRPTQTGVEQQSVSFQKTIT